MNKTREIIVTQTFNEMGVQIDVKTTPLVRCKDCGLCTYLQNIAGLSCVHHGGIVLPDDYCSYGERKEQEDGTC